MERLYHVGRMMRLLICAILEKSVYERVSRRALLDTSVCPDEAKMPYGQ